jgi:enoyl-CoA hydratase/carnithine racemase
MIQVKVSDAAGTIVLDRPKQCNALNFAMLEQLSQALSDLHQEKRVRAVILTGSGAHFCAGMDLKAWHDMSQSDQSQTLWFNDSHAMHNIIEQMLQFPKPIVAAVDGATLGSGLALVLACDLVVASHRATFSAAAARLGLVAGLVAPLATFRCGSSLASRLMLGGSQLTATDAQAVGLVHHLVDPEMIWVRAKTWIDSIAESSAEALQLSKRVINEMVGENLLTQLSSGASAMATALTTEAASEGLGAFVGKRPPKFPK